MNPPKVDARLRMFEDAYEYLRAQTLLAAANVRKAPANGPKAK